MKFRFTTVPVTMALFAMLLASAAQARPPDDEGSWRMGPPGAAQQLARLDQELGLSDEQSLQILELLQSAEADREALHARIMEEAGPEICAQRQNTEAEIVAILTPEQADLFQQLKSERQARRAHHRDRGMSFPDCP